MEMNMWIMSGPGAGDPGPAPSKALSKPFKQARRKVTASGFPTERKFTMGTDLFAGAQRPEGADGDIPGLRRPCRPTPWARGFTKRDKHQV